MAILSGDWMPFGSSGSGEPTYYRRVALYEMMWQGMDLGQYLVAAAPYGGPIAVTRDPKKLVQLSDKLREIYIFSAAGKEIGSFPWRGRGLIIEMGWNCSEELVLVGSDATVQIFNALGKQVKAFNFSEINGRLVMAKVYSTGLVVLTEDYDLWVVQDFEEDPPKPEMLPAPGILSEPLCLDVIPNPDGAEVLITTSPGLSDGGSILTVNLITGEAQEKGRRGTYQRVAVSPDGTFVATFDDKGKLRVTRNDFSGVLSEFDTESERPPSQLCWCARDAVVCIWQPELVDSSQSLVLIVGPTGQHENFQPDGAVFCVSEIDGLRIIDNFNSEFLQRVPKPTMDAFLIGSTKPSAALFDAWMEFENRSASSVKNVRNIGSKLNEAVTACIEAAGHEFDPANQRKCLKAAAYGKCFCEYFDSDEFLDMCKKLRVLNAVREKAIGIPLTVAQFDALTIDGLVDRLISRHLHLVARKICEYYNVKKGIEKVLVHWACAKVRSNTSHDDQAVTDLVVQKLSTSGCTPSYVQVASTAFQEGKRNQAIMLLDHEPKASEQVPLLLKMGEDDMALEKATNSGDTDMVYLVVLNMKRKLDKAQFFRVLVNNPQARDLIIAYCQEQDPKFLEQYYMTTQNTHCAAYMSIRQYFETADMKEKDRCLKQAKEGFAAKKKEAEAKIMEEQVQLLRTQEELEKATGKPIFLGLSVNETMYHAFMENQAKRAAKIQKDFNVPNKRFWWVKLRALCDQKDWESLEKFAKEKSPIGYKPFVEECLKAGSPAQAGKYIPKVTDVRERVEFYLQVSKIPEAIQDAVQDKNPELLQFILNKTSNENHRATIMEHLQQYQ
eukprot:TRINITY_DN10128_c0_g1_i1.p1 TRINITY_DN10128_c0_g1~~TRINITY_DN10128_c0_g1_i1.p1  ORF type:complete len:838 (-),score=192.58 TRINITY_DN10128_c0_g1_i1:55-2568(-)